MVVLAGHVISESHALEHVSRYAESFSETIRYYDYAGDTARLPDVSDGVDLADVARLVIINAQLRADDVAALMEPVDAAMWAAVPPDASFLQLPDNLHEAPLYRAVDALYDSYRARPGLGATKVTKLLHLKRPMLVPIVDSVAVKAYEAAAHTVGAELGSATPLYWAAMWRDARANSAEVARICASLRSPGGPRALAAELPALRLHDILVWDHFRHAGGCPLPD